MKSKTLLIVTTSVLLAARLVGGVYAAVTFMHGDTDELTNSLVADEDNSPEVSETFENNAKKDVAVVIPKTGYSVYVRAAIVVNWQKEGEDETFIYPESPVEGESGDYSLVLGDSEKWFKNGDFYYFTEPVPGDGTGMTDILIGTCTQLKEPPTGYILHVEVLTQTIQSAGTTDIGDKPAVQDAWGIEVDSETGNLIDPNA